MYYLRISGRLRSDKQPQYRPQMVYQSNIPPPDVPPWHTDWPDQPPYEIRGKLRRRERSRSPKRYPPFEQSYLSAASMPATSAEFAKMATQVCRLYSVFRTIDVYHLNLLTQTNRIPIEGLRSPKICFIFKLTRLIK